ncbi:aminotransferase class V-fold PLP-dependent enzyme [Kribbella swartbergensis]
MRADTPGVRSTIHFNNAGAGLLTRQTLKAMRDHIELEAQIGGYEAAALREEATQDFYRVTAELLRCAPGNIAFTSSATHAYSTALSSIPFAAGDLILTTRNDFISNQIAFLSLRKRFGVRIMHAPDAPEGGVDVEAMADLMRRHRPRLVAVTHVPTNSGLIQPVAEIGKVARELDLLYVVDACQSAGQLPLDVEHIGCDFLTSTPRKFLRGPRGSGFLYVSDRVLHGDYEPLFIDMYGARWTGTKEYQAMPSAARFEDWEFSYSTVLGCAAAIRYANEVGVETGGRRAIELAARLRAGLSTVPGVRVLDHGRQLGALVTFAIDGWQPEPFKASLDRLSINSALSFRHFAQYDFADKDVEWGLRLSPHYYNTEDEVAQVLAAIEQLAR